MNTKISRQQDTLLIEPSLYPDWDNFGPWAQKLLTNAGISQINTNDCGADRHMITFTFSQNRFSLNYENYSNSIWIETDEPSAIDKLDRLLTQLDAQLRDYN